MIYDNFGTAIKNIMKEKNITYGRLQSLANVSGTYLSKILLHGRIPSIEIIEKISRALKIDANLFKEYRVMKTVEKLQTLFWFLKENEIEELESFLEKVFKKNIPSEKYDKLKGGNSVGFYPNFILNLSILERHQSDIMKHVYNEFIDFNEFNKGLYSGDKKEPSYAEFENSYEYHEASERAAIEHQDGYDFDGKMNIFDKAFKRFEKRYFKEKNK